MASQLLLAILWAALAMVLILLVSVVWVILQMKVIAPGGGPADYVGSVLTFYLVAGGVVMILIGWWACRGKERTQAIRFAAMIGIAYFAFELAVQVVSIDSTASGWRWFAVSTVTKLCGAIVGGWIGSRPVPAETAP